MLNLNSTDFTAFIAANFYLSIIADWGQFFLVAASLVVALLSRFGKEYISLYFEKKRKKLKIGKYAESEESNTDSE